jgi:hypothetical protein
MNTKLTLTIEKDIVTKAKEYAYAHGRSLSDMVENYFEFLVHKKTSKINATPIVNSLKGSFNVPINFDYKEVLSDALVEKYL